MFLVFSNFVRTPDLKGASEGGGGLVGDRLDLSRNLLVVGGTHVESNPVYSPKYLHIFIIDFHSSVTLDDTRRNTTSYCIFIPTSCP
jgi:hypothetical protein